MTRIGILNTVALNGGDAAILEALLGVLRDAFGPDTRFAVFDRHPDAVARELGLSEVFAEPHRVFGEGAGSGPRRQAALLGQVLGLRGPRALLRLGAESRTLLQHMEACDAFVSTGGTYLTPPYRLEARLFHFELAHALKKPLVLATQSIGRYERRLQRAALATSLGRARAILLRDFRSQGHLDELGVQGPERVVLPDLAFGLASPVALQRAATHTFRSQLRIALSVRELHGFAGASAATQLAYEQAFAQLVAHLVQVHGAEVCFLSTCQGVAEYAHDDSRVAARIVGTLPAHVASRVEIDRGFHRPRALITRLQGFDAVVATRMHMAILALCAGTPALPVAYEFKTAELYEGLGLSAWLSHAQQLAPDTLVRRFERMCDQLHEERAPLMERIASYRDQARPTALFARVLAGSERAAAACAPGLDPASA